MNTLHILFITAGNIFTALIIAWWIKLGAVIIIAAAVFIFCRSRINKITHEKDELERQLLERSELLSYAKRDEQKAREQAEQAERNKKILLTKISHEIRTPMNGVMGMAALLNETTLNTEQKEYAAAILQSGDNLISLVNDILMNDVLEFSKNESGKKLEPKDFDLRLNIEEVLDVFASKAAKSGIDLLYNLAGNLPAQVNADPLRLRQILMNLVENAVKFTAKGEVFINVRFAENKEDSQAMLEFEVNDKGIGMGHDKTILLAKDLSNPNPSLTTAAVAGVGLIICTKLVNLMGGALSVESSENAGTTFLFSIKIKKAAEPLKKTTVPEMTGLENKKVLIVDDNETSCELIKQQLEQWNLVAVTATSGKKALEILQLVPGFNLVLTDLEMPVMDGVEVAQTIKNQHAGVPVVLLNKIGDERYRKYPGLFISVFNKPVKQYVLSEHVFNGLRYKPGNAENEQISTQVLSADFSKQYPFSILVAEDNTMNQMLITRILGKLGFKPHMCNNGQEVLEEVSLHNYDLILMDVQMPLMDGLEATRMIRVCLNTQPTIIAMTANALQGDREECLKAGMDDYIDKPLKLDELVAMLEKWACKLKKTESKYSEA